MGKHHDETPVYRQALERSPDTRENWENFCDELTHVVNTARKCFGAAPDFKLVRGIGDSHRQTFSINTTVLVPLTPPEPSGNSGDPLAPTRPACRVRMRIDVHTETFTLTISADKFDLTSQHPINKALAALISGENRLPSLFDELWDGEGTPFGSCLAGLEKLRGSLFGDFRGVIVSANTPPSQGAQEPTSDTHFERVLQTGRGSHRPLHPNLRSFLTERRSLIDEMMRHFNSDKDSATAERGSEWVVCSMLDGHFLYAAPLVHWGSGAAPQPIRYLLVGANTLPDQVGRLVRRLHVLGELRHTALLDYDLGDPQAKDLKRASAVIRVLGQMLDRETDRDADRPETQIQPSALKAVNEALTGLNQFADGGITYRVEQSRYYASAFKERIGDLRVGRIEGYQPYDAFIRRNVFALFSKIDQIGRRYDALGRRVDRLTFLSDAQSSELFYKEIMETTKEIKKVALKIETLQGLGDRFLHNAEKFATVFLVYYVGSVLKDALEGLGPGDESKVHFSYYLIWAATVVVVILDVAGNDSKFSNWVFKHVAAVGRILFALLGMIWDSAIGFPGRLVRTIRRRERQDNRPKSDS